MSDGYKLQLVGDKELIDRLQNAEKTIQTEFQAAINKGAQAIAGEAKMRAPVNYGILKNSIGATRAQASADGFTADVVSGANYSAYVEFGTGTKVSVPADLTDFAMQFKGTHQVKGMAARPFFFPAAKRIAPIIDDESTKILDKI